MSNLAILHNFLRRHRVSRTRTRELLFTELQHSGPITTKELVSQLADKVGSSAVYLNLRLFVKLGIAHRNGAGEYELTNRLRQHRHYLNCRNCGRRIAFNDPSLEQALTRLSHRRLFTLQDHELVLTGLCALCANAAPPPRPTPQPHRQS